MSSIITDGKIDIDKLEVIEDVDFNDNLDAYGQLGECKSEVKKVEICRANTHKLATATNALIGSLWAGVNEAKATANKAELKAQSAIDRHDRNEKVIEANTDAMHLICVRFATLEATLKTFCKTIFWVGGILTTTVMLIAAVYGVLK